MIDPRTPSWREWMGGFEAGGVRRGSVLADRYELGGELGRGGMGRVYRAHDRLLGRDVAVKVLAADDLGDGEFARACAREARAAARLVHPGIVTVHDIGVHGGQSFLVMELVTGPTLRQLLVDGPLSPGRAVEIGAQVADALDYAHRRGVLHCDVKPQNIMMTDEAVTPPGAPLSRGRAKLLDFGISRAASSTRSFTGGIGGTVGYMAPEQVLGEPIDGRTDVYALGVVLYEMLAGRPPFEAENAIAVLTRRLTADPPPLWSFAPAVPPELEAVVLTALQREPVRRPATAGALRDALDRVESVAVAETATPADATRPASRRPSMPARPMAYPRRHDREPRSLTGAAQLRLWPRLGLALAGILALLGLGLILATMLGRPTAPTASSEETAPLELATAPAPITPSPASELSALGEPAGPTVGPEPTPTSVPTASAAAEQEDKAPGFSWATFTMGACEWSDPRQAVGECFGTRPVGYRVRVIELQGSRWQIWDQATDSVAYVNANALKLD